MKLKQYLITIIGIIMIAVILLGTVYIYALKENTKCINEPFTYHAEKAFDQGMNLECFCTVEDPKYASFSFNKENITISPV